MSGKKLNNNEDHSDTDHVHDENCNHGHHHHMHMPYERHMPKLGRNDPCICGSGKKYKKCCLE